MDRRKAAVNDDDDDDVLSLVVALTVVVAKLNMIGEPSEHLIVLLDRAKRFIARHEIEPSIAAVVFR